MRGQTIKRNGLGVAGAMAISMGVAGAAWGQAGAPDGKPAPSPIPAPDAPTKPAATPATPPASAASGFRGWQAMRVIRAEGMPMGMTVADLDGDGRGEIVLVNTRHSRLEIYDWLPPAQRAANAADALIDDRQNVNYLPMASDFRRTELPMTELPRQVLATDLDGDGQVELVVLAGPPNKVLVYKQDAKAKPAAAKPELKPEAGAAKDAPAPDAKPKKKAKPDPKSDAKSDAKNDVKNDIKNDAKNDAKPDVASVAVARSGWTQWKSWDLLPGNYAAAEPLMLRPGAGEIEFLISLDQGIQTLKLAKSDPKSDNASSVAKVEWLSPRDKQTRHGWWLADIDGDGALDLVEAMLGSAQSLRWRKATPAGLLPARPLYDKPLDDAEILRVKSHAADILVLGGAQKGLMRRFKLDHGPESPVGLAQTLPLPAAGKPVWAGLSIQGKPALVAVDPAQPRLLVHTLAAEGWSPASTFPSVGAVQALAAPVKVPGKDGLVLLWAKDAAELLVCQWDQGRLSYPKPRRALDEKAGESRILALDTVEGGGAVWWAQRVGATLSLFVWEPGSAEPKETAFPGADAGKIDAVAWLGGARLLASEKYARSAKLLSLVEGKGQFTEPAHLAKAGLGEFRVFGQGDKRRTARITEGVVQWLGEDLHPTDQVMLPEGASIADFLPDAVGPQAWALESGAGMLHRMKPDAAGILRPEKGHKVEATGLALVRDAALGLVLVEANAITRLSPGRPVELKLIDQVDSRAGRPEGAHRASIHRMGTLDVTGDGKDDVLLLDAGRHQFTLMERTEQGLSATMSWPIFEDRVYPYSGDALGDERLDHEPRGWLAGDLDGDGGQDLVLLCHDRLLIYLAKE